MGSAHATWEGKESLAIRLGDPFTVCSHCWRGRFDGGKFYWVNVSAAELFYRVLSLLWSVVDLHQSQISTRIIARLIML
jgi:hypothetical protein